MRDGLLISGGLPETRPTSRLRPPKSIEILEANTLKPQRVRPYRLRLERWKGKGKAIPCIRLHPFALAHLVVTAQAPRPFLLEMAWEMNTPLVAFTEPVTESCELATMLGVKRFALRFATNHDCEVVAM